MRLLAFVALCGLVTCLSYYLARVYARWRAARAEARARVVPPGPPASHWERLYLRVTTCRRRGHTYRVAFVPRYRHQCLDCGALRRVDVLCDARLTRGYAVLPLALQDGFVLAFPQTLLFDWSTVALCLYLVVAPVVVGGLIWAFARSIRAEHEKQQTRERLRREVARTHVGFVPAGRPDWWRA